MPSISVIVPLYNLQDYIGPCIDGLCRQQTEFEFEVIVLDDGSVDQSSRRVAALAQEYPHLRFYENGRNRGLAATMQRLLTLAEGDYIAYVDGDDLAYPGKLQALAGHLRDHADCGLAYHDAQLFDSDSGAVMHRYTADHYNIAHVPDVATAAHLVRYGCFINASSIMYKRHDHLCDAVAAECKILLDYPFHILNTLYGGGSIHRLPQILAGYRQHGSSFGAQNRADSKRRLQCLRDQEWACDLAGRLGVDADLVEQGKIHHRFAAALYFLKNGQDRLFQELIAAASDSGWFFDDRQRYAMQHNADPEKVRRKLFDGQPA